MSPPDPSCFSLKAQGSRPPPHAEGRRIVQDIEWLGLQHCVFAVSLAVRWPQGEPRMWFSGARLFGSGANAIGALDRFFVCVYVSLVDMTLVFLLGCPSVCVSFCVHAWVCAVCVFCVWACVCICAAGLLACSSCSSSSVHSFGLFWSCFVRLFLSVCLPVCLSVCLPVCLYPCLSVGLSGPQPLGSHRAWTT